MKRDWNQIREILIGLEAHDDILATWEPDNIRCINVHDPAGEVEYLRYAEQVRLLVEAGLVQGAAGYVFSGDDRTGVDFATQKPYRLTWRGHEFLNAIRDDQVWRKIQATTIDKGSSLSFDIIKELGITLVKSALGLAQ